MAAAEYFVKAGAVLTRGGEKKFQSKKGGLWSPKPLQALVFDLF